MTIVVSSKRIVELARATDPRQALIDAVDVSKIRTFGQNLLVATYIRPEKTKGGIYRPDSDIQNDELQGNVGLVLQVGEAVEEGEELLHKWVRFGYNEGLKWRYADIPLRDIDLGRIRGIVDDPRQVF
jgi:hypothetical protein